MDKKVLVNFFSCTDSQIEEIRSGNIHLLHEICDNGIHQTFTHLFSSQIQSKLSTYLMNLLDINIQMINLYSCSDNANSWLSLTVDGLNICDELNKTCSRMQESRNTVLKATETFRYSKNSFVLPDFFNSGMDSMRSRRDLRNHLWKAVFLIRLLFVKCLGRVYRLELDKYLSNLNLYNPFIFKALGCKNYYPGIESFERSSPFRGELRNIKSKK